MVGQKLVGADVKPRSGLRWMEMEASRKVQTE